MIHGEFAAAFNPAIGASPRLTPQRVKVLQVRPRSLEIPELPAFPAAACLPADSAPPAAWMRDLMTVAAVDSLARSAETAYLARPRPVVWQVAAARPALGLNREPEVSEAVERKREGWSR